MSVPEKFYSLGEHDESIFENAPDSLNSIKKYFFKNQEIGRYGSKNSPCFTTENGTLLSHYYIGVDWICEESGKVIHVSPKLNKSEFETDYLKMVLMCLEDPKASKFVKKIYEIKTDSKPIEINQSQDLISPIIIFRFLNLVKELVKKGLKKSYYRVERNLNSRIKGKLLVSQTLKHHAFKNEALRTRCAFDVFGLDHPENQILKAALKFTQKYLSRFPDYSRLAQRTLNFCLPAFEEVTIPRNLTVFKDYKTSPFFSTYKEALSLAKHILRRNGFNVRTANAKRVSTQPFWINMALLFELYTYTLLRKEFGNKIYYQYKSDYQELDFLLKDTDLKMVIDTKYKTRYGEGERNKEDIRQISGYARMEKVYNELEKDHNSVIDCLIIYPKRSRNLEENLHIERIEPINKYVGFYKLEVEIPFIPNNT